MTERVGDSGSVSNGGRGHSSLPAHGVDTALGKRLAAGAVDFESESPKY